MENKDDAESKELSQDEKDYRDFVGPENYSHTKYQIAKAMIW